MGKQINLAGRRFGRLVAVKRVLVEDSRSVQWKVSPKKWHCVCDCGNTILVRTEMLIRGDYKSCGCLHRSHGQSHTPLYSVWKELRARCSRPSHIQYAHYGGRGIRVHPAWEQSFQAFAEAVGPKPGPGYSIDRIDNDQGYVPGNVRWATTREQQANRRPRAAPKKLTGKA